MTDSNNDAPVSAITPVKESAPVLKKAWMLMTEAIDIYKGHYQTLLTLSAIILVPSFLYSVFMEKVVFSAILNTFGFIATIIFSILLVILVVVVSSLGQIALMYAIKDREKGISVSRAFDFAWEKLLSCWWIMFLTGFIAFGGFVLFFIPGFIIAMWFCMASYVLIAEEEKGMNALLKSREYMKGKIFSVLWRFIFVGFPAIVLIIPMSMLFAIFPEPWGSLLSGNVFSLVFTPFSIIYWYLLYKSLVSVKGEFAFEPKQKTKNIFIAIGIAGIIIPIIVISLLGWRATYHSFSVAITEISSAKPVPFGFATTTTNQ